MTLFVCVNLLATIFEMEAQSKLKRFDPLGEARLCVARGVLTDAWEMMLSCGFTALRNYVSTDFYFYHNLTYVGGLKKTNSCILVNPKP